MGEKNLLSPCEDCAQAGVLYWLYGVSGHDALMHGIQSLGHAGVDPTTTNWVINCAKPINLSPWWMRHGTWITDSWTVRCHNYIVSRKLQNCPALILTFSPHCWSHFRDPETRQPTIDIALLMEFNWPPELFVLDYSTRSLKRTS